MNQRTRTDWLLLVGICLFLFFYGLGQFGLLGADEPRYAQVAREMLERHDWITPTLDGHAWLEKPVLYYWQAMVCYRLLGVSDWAARVPSAVNASLLVMGVYLFLRWLRPGVHLDGALITASIAGVVGFAHAAAPDMPLAAMFGLAMLAWYAWWETSQKRFLGAFYVFLALATLAKGPVAPVLAGGVVLLFAAVARDLRILRQTLWIPGIAWFAVVALPWYVVVQIRNPEFFRLFILEHNLARFGTDLYHHREPFWFYLPVAALGLMPWVVFVVASAGETLRAWWSEPTALFESGDALNVYLLLWLVVPVGFFSISQSKLPGYIVPALPAGTLLVSEYLRRHLEDEERTPLWLVALHALVASAPVVPALLIQYLLLQHRLSWGSGLVIASLVALVLAAGIAFTLRGKLGLRMLRFVTLIPVVVTVGALIKFGASQCDAVLSARPLARQLTQMETKPLPVAILGTPREMEYGLTFYRNQTVPRYELGEIPREQHLLVAPRGSRDSIAALLGGRRFSYLGTYAPQQVDYFWVAKSGE